MSNPEVRLNLDEAVAEVLGLLTGLNLDYQAEEDRYYAVVRQLNRALRSVATEGEWSYYSDMEDVGLVHAGDRTVELRPTVRPRIMVDDTVKLCRPDTGYPVVWAHFLPREAIDKTPNRDQLWVAHSRSTLTFSRPFKSSEEGLMIRVPVMREPKMFRLPVQPVDPNAPTPVVPMEVREQLVDFEWPDLVILKAAYFYAQADAIMQPRVQTLEANYKDLMYNLRERDTRNTDSPMMNPYFVDINNDIHGSTRTSHRPYGEAKFY